MPIFRVPEKLVKCGLAKACILNNKFFKAVYIENIFSPSKNVSKAFPDLQALYKHLRMAFKSLPKVCLNKYCA